jgi:hypothetical protein
LRTQLEEARAELEKARQQLEQAARGVAVASAAPFQRSVVSVRDGEPLDVDVDIRGAPVALRATRLEQGQNRFVITQNDPPVQVFSSAPTPAVTNVLRTFSIATSPWSDMELVAVTEGLGRYFGTAEGLLVVRGPGNDAIGIGDGDVILSINGRTPSSPEHALRILGSYEPGETIGFSIMRDRQTPGVDYLVPDAGGPARG